MDLITFVSGVLIVAGGLLGFIKKRSTASLIAGSGSGAALIYAAVMADRLLGQKIALFVSLILAVVMGMRYRKSRAFMPAGLVTAISVMVALVNAYKLFL